MKEYINMENLMGACNYVFYFLVLNFCFVICNLPILLYFLSVGMTGMGTYLPLLLICLIPVGPALCALFHCMFRLIKNRDLKVLRDYIYGYKRNFMQAVKLASVQVILVFLFVNNISLFTESYPNLFLVILFTILFVLLLFMTPYLYFMTARYEMRSLNIFKGALTIVFTKPVLSICSGFCFLFVLMLFEITAGTTVLFISSIYAFLIVVCNKKLINQLEGVELGFKK